MELPNPLDGPRHMHGCEHCAYLGTHGRFDLYVCGTILIVRYGDAEHDSASLSLARWEGSTPAPFDEAYRRAVAAGRIPQ